MWPTQHPLTIGLTRQQRLSKSSRSSLGETQSGWARRRDPLHTNFCDRGGGGGIGYFSSWIYIQTTTNISVTARTINYNNHLYIHHNLLNRTDVRIWAFQIPARLSLSASKSYFTPEILNSGLLGKCISWFDRQPENVIFNITRRSRSSFLTSETWLMWHWRIAWWRWRRCKWRDLVANFGNTMQVAPPDD